LETPLAFEPGSAGLMSREAVDALRAIAAILRANPEARVEVEAVDAPSGTARAREWAVAAFLAAYGDIPLENITMTAPPEDFDAEAAAAAPEGGGVRVTVTLTAPPAASAGND